VYEVARIMHQHGGVVFFDFAASGPYVEINMTKDEESYFDGIYLSMHKFLGGPGASGLLILNKDVYCGGNTPCSTGGGTVKYVTHDDHRYLMDYEDREDAGTPGIMQVIRAAMALELKDTLGSAEIERVELDYIRRAFDALGKVENIDILGNNDPEKRIAIMSFNIRYKNGYLHHGFVSTLLNDLFGIQSRAGCACAGPYGIEILNIDEKRVNRFKEIIDAGIDSMKPGWSRINFHYTFDKATFDYIIDAIKFVANYGHEFLGEYKVSCVKGTWEHRDSVEAEHAELSILKALLGKRETLKTKKMNYGKLYKKYMKLAQKTRLTLQSNEKKHVLFSDEMFADIAWFYHAEVGV